jgi:hypothetical protein
MTFATDQTQLQVRQAGGGQPEIFCFFSPSIGGAAPLSAESTDLRHEEGNAQKTTERGRESVFPSKSALYQNRGTALKI